MINEIINKINKKTQPKFLFILTNQNKHNKNENYILNIKIVLKLY